MSSERWHKAQELFAELLAVEAEERPRWLSERCGDDSPLEALVLSMVASDEVSDGFLEEPVARLGDSEPAVSSPLAAGQMLGAYRILGPLGEGGMSTVYRAQRADAAFDLEVVIKVVRHGLETEENLRRLRIERQILAGLDHPNISRLYDGGTTVENLPYFVMEYVDGEPIDRFCDGHLLTLRERVELFTKVCRAVRYAHRQLVVHRDLKPANVLVTADGEPKLLDFGIAKLLQDPGVEEPAQTSVFLRRLTPDYASPEQIRGDLMTTSSDVYSLGVMLYVLLVGALPRRLEDRTWGSVERAAQREILPPSRVVSKAMRAGSGTSLAKARGTRPEIWKRQLEGDLEAIVLRALEPAPTDRYPSVEELSRDLDAYLRGFPIDARVPTAFYRLRKFVGRNRSGVLAATAVILLVSTTLGSFVAHARQTARQRDELQAVIDSVKGLLNVAGEGEKLTARQIVDRSAAMVETTLAGQPQLEGTLRQTMGAIYLSLGVPEQALEQLSQAYALERSIHGAESLEAATSQSLLSLAAAQENDLETAAEAARHSLDTARRQIGPQSPQLVSFLNNMVTVLCFTGDYSAADPYAETAVQLARNLPEDRLDKAKAISNRAYLTAEDGRPEDAIGMYRQVLELHRRYRGEEHPEVLGVMNNLSLLLGDLGRPEEKEAVLRETLELQGRLLGVRNPERIRTLNNLAGALLNQGDLAGAEAIQEEAVTLAQEVLPPGHFASLLAETRLSEIQLQMGKSLPAIRRLEEGLQVWRPSLAGSWFVGYAESVLGSALVQGGRQSEGEALLLKGYRILRDLRGEDFRRTQQAARRLEELYRSQGRLPELRGSLEEENFTNSGSP